MSKPVAAIDTHAHVYPAWYLDRLVEAGADAEATKVARDMGADSTEHDMRKRIEGMDAAGVAKQNNRRDPAVAVRGGRRGIGKLGPGHQ